VSVPSGIFSESVIGLGAGIGSDDRTGGNNASLRIPTENTHNAMVTEVVIIRVCNFYLFF
jgi:hypothetical protein